MTEGWRRHCNHDQLWENQYKLFVSECFGRFNSSLLQFLAQHSGCAKEAYFSNNGVQALVICDDPSKETMILANVTIIMQTKLSGFFGKDGLFRVLP